MSIIFYLNHLEIN